VDFSFTSEQDDLRREARAFLEANQSPTMEQLDELGWVGILQGEDFTFLDAAVLFEELGRSLYDGPYVLNEVAGQPGDDIWSIEIDGFVPHHAEVGHVLKPSLEPDVRRRVLAAFALEAVGIGSKVTELAIAYASEREQFGKKIGSYQAISHSLVDAYVAVELSRSLAYWAAWCVAEDDAQVDLAVAAAKSQATEAAVLACEKSIQAHGGIGFTWEHPLHRYYKRALWLEGALGYGREHRAEVAASLLSS
jgi:alkylation response protein AidB-like acyl-CoA dehydrogenase